MSEKRELRGTSITHGDVTLLAASQERTRQEADEADNMNEEAQGNAMPGVPHKGSMEEVTPGDGTQEASEGVNMQEAAQECIMQDATQASSLHQAAHEDKVQEVMQETNQGGSMQKVTQGSSVQEGKGESNVEEETENTIRQDKQKRKVHKQTQMHSKKVAAQEGRVPESRRDWIQRHPKFLEMMALNVASSTDVYTTFLVYLDLVEGRNWHEVRYKALRDLQLICLCAREKEGQCPQVVVPTSIGISYSHERIQHIMERTRSLEAEEGAPSSVVLAIVASDSTVVYYRLTEGFVTPEPPDMIEDIDNKQFRKKRRKL
ncbi:tRNA-splicing endonuclease subunit Sen15 [Lissotriton helveticus]